MLVYLGYDKLKMYAILVFGVAVVIWFIYKSYCNRKFLETNYSFSWDKVLYKTLINYAGWNLFGNIASVAMGQGVNILLNLFFGPIVNAARGIAFQVNSAVNGFVINFQMAMNPQIVKSYAGNDLEYMHQLIYKGSKYSFFLLFLLVLPILIETELILHWWLKIVPAYTALFCRLILINTLIDCISGTLMTSAQASGKIKVYQSVVGGLLLFILPISYLLLKLGLPPQTTLCVSISISIIALFTRLMIIRNLISLSIKEFLKSVLVPILLVSVLSIVFPFIIKLSLNQEILRFFSVCISSVISVTITIYFLGLKKEERFFMKNKVRLFTIKVKNYFN